MKKGIMAETLVSLVIHSIIFIALTIIIIAVVSIMLHKPKNASAENELDNLVNLLNNMQKNKISFAETTVIVPGYYTYKILKKNGKSGVNPSSCGSSACVCLYKNWGKNQGDKKLIKCKKINIPKITKNINIGDENSNIDPMAPRWLEINNDNKNGLSIVVKYDKAKAKAKQNKQKQINTARTIGSHIS